MKVFEETFGIDKLQSMVNKIEDKIDDVSTKIFRWQNYYFDNL